jgi:hypothetical protein
MNHKPKIEENEEPWESGVLGTSMDHAVPASPDIEAAVESSLGLQLISIRLPKHLIEAYKLIAAHHGVGYQPLMRDILQRFVPEGLKEVLQHHEVKAVEAHERIGELQKAA